MRLLEDRFEEGAIILKLNFKMIVNNVLLMIKPIVIGFIIVVSIAFVTLFERKILSFSQCRTGPVKSYWLGVLQSIADFIKLFSKNF